MIKTEAQTAIKKLSVSLNDLSPTALITLFEIDLEQIALGRGVSLPENQKVFRFHNHVKLLDTSIFWRGNEYVAAPIMANGFEMTSKGTLPTPKLGIIATEEGSQYLALLKQKMVEFDDLIGAKVTRIRTFVEDLDAVNFIGTDKTYPNANQNAELPRDIYYVERKANESKSAVELELASVIDIEGIKLPGRVVYANRCVATYRCEGCIYEYSDRYNELIHGEGATLPSSAPPIANDKDELITDILGNSSISSPEEYDSTHYYVIGSCVYIKKDNIPYYFVAKIDDPPSGPPNLSYWIADQCSKSVKGCRLRWKNIGNRYLPFVGFPSANKLG
jgi:lambda family phage minor tail protein L